MLARRTPRARQDSGLRTPPGATREARFRAEAPGTYHYWGSTAGRGIEEREWFESLLSGALVVDAPGTPADDRVVVIGYWFRPGDSTGAVRRPDQNVMVINGRSWPHAERFTFTDGDSVRCRWVNPTSLAHPMHLHGFYFHLESRGDWRSERRYDGGARPFLVTNLMLPGETMRLSWVPERPGNWVFHCHFAFHVSHHMVLARGAPAAATDARRMRDGRSPRRHRPRPGRDGRLRVHARRTRRAATGSEDAGTGVDHPHPRVGAMTSRGGGGPE
jgi:hypothetical protein